MNSSSVSSWRLLGRELLDRFILPWKHPSFLGYFIGGVVFFGALGVWFELIELFGPPDPKSPDSSLRIALLGTFPAILGPACMQILWSEAAKFLKTLSMLVLLTTLAAAVYFARPVISDAMAVKAYGWLTAGAMLVWWIANANNTELHDNIDAPTGGDTNKQLSGSLAGFKS